MACTKKGALVARLFIVRLKIKLFVVVCCLFNFISGAFNVLADTFNSIAGCYKQRDRSDSECFDDVLHNVGLLCICRLINVADAKWFRNVFGNQYKPPTVVFSSVVYGHLL